jgi:hypothetical protein
VLKWICQNLRLGVGAFLIESGPSFHCAR